MSLFPLLYLESLQEFPLVKYIAYLTTVKRVLTQYKNKLDKRVRTLWTDSTYPSKKDSSSPVIKPIFKSCSIINVRVIS